MYFTYRYLLHSKEDISESTNSQSPNNEGNGNVAEQLHIEQLSTTTSERSNLDDKNQTLSELDVGTRANFLHSSVFYAVLLAIIGIADIILIS